jgi:hypothetical protein
VWPPHSKVAVRYCSACDTDWTPRGERPVDGGEYGDVGSPEYTRVEERVRSTKSVVHRVMVAPAPWEGESGSPTSGGTLVPSPSAVEAATAVWANRPKSSSR